MSIPSLSSSITSTDDLILSNAGSKKRKIAEREFDIDQMFGNVKVIDELVLSYFTCEFKPKENQDDAIDNIKSYLFIGHVSNRDDLKLISYFMTKEISMYVVYLSKNKPKDIYRLFNETVLGELLELNGLCGHYDSLSKNVDAISSVVQYNGSFLKYVSESIITRDVALRAVRQNPKVLKYLSSECKDDKEVVLTAVKVEGSLLEFASEKLKGDLEVVKAAFQNNILAIVHANKKLQSCEELGNHVFPETPFVQSCTLPGPGEGHIECSMQ